MKKIAVIMGGLSGEREVSLSSGKGVVAALKRLGYTVKPIDLTKDIAAFVKALKTFQPDVVFNALHGAFGEDGCVQGLLDLMHIPYTHSGVLASALGMDKEKTREIAQKIGVPVAKGGLRTKEEMKKKMPALPYVAKPNADGSSLGVFIVKTKKEHAQLLKKWGKDKYKLVEEYIPGRELTAAVLNNRCIGTLELVPKSGFYDYKNKYTSGKTDHLIPAPLPKKQADLIAKYAEQIHTVLGCRGVTRSDFRYDDSDKRHPRLVFLEINTNPGMTPFSLVPDIAKYKKITYDMLVEKLLKEAQCD
ncbi:MAG: D-alanine--D-alanine ligase [Alphaproteobacteria bacterium]|nr:D-alanine--D-alanine ligase [Alphaproteobacteria bacterium]